jgi:hypothetical protein
MKETPKEMLFRLRLMSDGDLQWDLSDKDMQAIGWAKDCAKKAAFIVERIRENRNQGIHTNDDWIEDQLLSVLSPKEGK